MARLAASACLRASSSSMRLSYCSVMSWNSPLSRVQMPFSMIGSPLARTQIRRPLAVIIGNSASQGLPLSIPRWTSCRISSRASGA